MGVWILVSLAAVVGLVGTVAALLATRPERELPPRGPAWLLPSPRDVRSPRFRRSFPGYHPADVDAHLEAVALAYEALYGAAGSEAVERAEREVAMRRGGEEPDQQEIAAVPDEARHDVGERTAAEGTPSDVGTEPGGSGTEPDVR